MQTNIILVRPQLSENIGMVARVCLNFNLNNIIIIDPKDKDFFFNANQVSCGALEQMNLSISQNLNTSLLSSNKILAFSSRKRNLNKPVINLNNLASEIKNVPSNSSVSFIFGCERTGLTNQELSCANKIVTIETNQNFPVLNLAQSVAILAHKLQEIQTNKLISKNQIKGDLASKKEMDFFFNLLFDSIKNNNHFKNNPKQLENLKGNLKSIYLKNNISSKELQYLITFHKFLTPKE